MRPWHQSNNPAWLLELVRRNVGAAKSESRESSHDSNGIVASAVHPNIHVGCSSDVTVVSHGVSAHKLVANSILVQQLQELAEVARKGRSHRGFGGSFQRLGGVLAGSCLASTHGRRGPADPAEPPRRPIGPRGNQDSFRSACSLYDTATPPAPQAFYSGYPPAHQVRPSVRTNKVKIRPPAEVPYNIQKQETI